MNEDEMERFNALMMYNKEQLIELILELDKNIVSVSPEINIIPEENNL